MLGHVKRGREFGVAQKEKGVTLLMSQVFLLILTVLGLSSLQMVSMQANMARNYRDMNLAFLSAEAALSEAEAFIEALGSLSDFEAPGANGMGLYYGANYKNNPNWMEVNWENDTGAYITATMLEGSAEAPKYIIAHLKAQVSDGTRLNLDNIRSESRSVYAQIFRVTAYGTGGSRSAHVMLQSTYGKYF